ncbi:MAG: (2Fe-2S)-binding protein, partial [Colwellia sp.]|nr:(2Fe-2S)-binding protein [Colwellia sp.]
MSDEVTGKIQNNKVTIYIDDVPYQVSAENNLLAGVLSNKLNLPYFCWHPSLGSVGACRQCAVTQYMDENDTRGRLVMSCMTPVVEGMRIGLTDKASAKFRQQVIAAMMTNHPHDCPVCAEGGECHLQDMTVMTGHSTRQYQGEKRTFTNQYLGELVGHEMNRCITCYRCVRFYKDYAGGKDFDVFGSRNQVYFGRQKDGVLESAFSGNLVEVCPTGVFTNKLFSAHYTRKWDLQSAPSVCAHCSIGCNTSIGERYGSVRRVMNRYNHELNGYFLCDRGRFGIGFVNSMARIRTIKGVNSKVEELSVGLFNEKNFAKAISEHSNESFIGIGSARASFEANRLLKHLVGKNNFSLGYTNQEMQLSLRHKQLLAQYPQQSLTGME